MRHDDIVDIAFAGRDIRIGEIVFVILGVLGNLGLIAKVLAEDDLDRAFGAHDRDFGCRPGIIHVAAQVFRTHHIIRAAIGLARDHGDFRHRRFGISEEQFGAMLDQTAIFLLGPGHEARHVDKGDDRNVETIAKADKARTFARRINVQNAGQRHRLIGHKADRGAFHPAKAAYDIGAKSRADFKEVTFIDRLLDQLLHVIGLVRIVRDQCVETVIDALNRIISRPNRRIFAIGARQEIDQAPHLRQRFNVIFERAIDDA